jgi:hypothetical protein
VVFDTNQICEQTGLKVDFHKVVSHLLYLFGADLQRATEPIICRVLGKIFARSDISWLSMDTGVSDSSS